MFDIKWIRANPEDFDAGMAARMGNPVTAAALVSLDDARRQVVSDMNAAQQTRNALSRQIGQAKAQKDEAAATQLLAQVAGLKDQISQKEAQARDLEQKIASQLNALPNLAAPGVPVGEDEGANVEYFGPNRSPGLAAKTRPPKRQFDFAPKEHYELGEAFGGLDFEAAAGLSGSRFVVIKGPLARLERAIGQFMLDLHVTEHGFTEVQTPLLVRDEALFGTGQLPKFEEDLFFAPHGEGRLALIPTAEVPLTNLVRQSMLPAADLPLRFCALTPCFRSEAGSAGRDTRGMLRQHQFNKVEMVCITRPDNSADEHERMLGCAEEVLKRLEIHYRVQTLCTGDMGFAAAKTYDIEAWLPGQNTYREISSISNCNDFQARRMDARFRDPEGSLEFVHTLNGSGVAVGRALIAVMENYQNADGSITVPGALRPYMAGIERIGGAP
jgi:seryl-tRNA synthetase